LPTEKLNINRTLQVFLAIGGSATLCTYYGSWQNPFRLVYDIPSTFIMCAFMAQIVCEGLRRQFSSFWWTRAILMIPLSLIPAGRDLIGWSISGHVTNMLAVGLITTTDRRLSVAERIAYWVPFPIVLTMHWFIFDVQNRSHWDTYNALLVGTLIFWCRMYIPIPRIQKVTRPLTKMDH